MWTTLDGHDPTPDQVYDLQKVYILVTAIVYFVLIWDYLSNLHNEYRLFYKDGRNHPFSNRNILSINNAFLVSRYITLAWCTFVVACYGLVEQSPHICSWAKYFPYGYSTTMLFAHFVMALRIYTVYERKKRILYMLLGMAGADYAIQMAANHAATAVYLHSESPRIGICYLQPTSMVYALVFISPTVFHHLVLLMTLYKSIKHIRATRAGGIRSIMQVVQRDQILFVLAICLINFSNLVLVLQRSSWPYKLINQLPAAAFTQIFLSRIVFNLKLAQIRLASANVTPDLSILPLSPTSARTFSPGITEKGNESTLWGSSSQSRSTFSPDIISSAMKGGAAGSSANLPSLAQHSSYGFGMMARDGSKSSLHRSLLAARQDAENRGNSGNVFSLHFDPQGQASRRKLKKGATHTHRPSDSYAMSIQRSQQSEPLSALASSPNTASGLAIYENNEGDMNNNDETAVASLASLSPISPTFSTTALHFGQSAHRYDDSVDSKRFTDDLTPKAATKDSVDEETDQGDAAPLSSTTGLTAEGHTISEDAALPSPSDVFTQPLVLPKEEEEEDVAPARASFESRTGTIDEQQRTMDWEPPSTWGSTGSHRGSPIPFSERRLSNSVARSSLLPLARELTPTRSRRTSANGISPSRRLSAGSTGASLSNVATANAAGAMNAASGPSRPYRTSACYASVFSFENEEAVDEDEEDDSQLRVESLATPAPTEPSGNPRYSRSSANRPAL